MVKAYFAVNTGQIRGKDSTLAPSQLHYVYSIEKLTPEAGLLYEKDSLPHSTT